MCACVLRCSAGFMLANILPLLLVRTANALVAANPAVSRSFFKQQNNFCTSAMAYTAEQRGCRNAADYKLYCVGPNGACSYWHDVPLYADQANGIMNMVVEIPRWTNAKMEMCTTERMNYIKQDVKKGKLRFVGNIFPHHGYIWNYGAFPQTWEDPNHVDEHTNCKGDNDPLDVCEIGDKVHERGSVIQVKVLGIMAMIDEGETDWKVIVIDVNDSAAAQMNDIEDVEKLKPGLLRATYEWFVNYKIPDGKPKNVFAFNGEAKNRAFAMEIVKQTGEQWRKLVMNETENAGLCRDNINVSDSSFVISQDEANAAMQGADPAGPDQPSPADVDKNHFVC